MNDMAYRRRKSVNDKVSQQSVTKPEKGLPESYIKHISCPVRQRFYRDLEERNVTKKTPSNVLRQRPIVSKMKSSDDTMDKQSILDEPAPPEEPKKENIPSKEPNIVRRDTKKNMRILTANKRMPVPSPLTEREKNALYLAQQRRLQGKKPPLLCKRSFTVGFASTNVEQQDPPKSSTTTATATTQVIRTNQQNTKPIKKTSLTQKVGRHIQMVTSQNRLNKAESEPSVHSRAAQTMYHVLPRTASSSRYMNSYNKPKIRPIKPVKLAKRKPSKSSLRQPKLLQAQQYKKRRPPTPPPPPRKHPLKSKISMRSAQSNLPTGKAVNFPAPKVAPKNIPPGKLMASTHIFAGKVISSTSNKKPVVGNLRASRPESSIKSKNKKRRSSLAIVGKRITQMISSRKSISTPINRNIKSVDKRFSKHSVYHMMRQNDKKKNGMLNVEIPESPSKKKEARTYDDAPVFIVRPINSNCAKLLTKSDIFHVDVKPEEHLSEFVINGKPVSVFNENEPQMHNMTRPQPHHHRIIRPRLPRTNFNSQSPLRSKTADTFTSEPYEQPKNRNLYNKFGLRSENYQRNPTYWNSNYARPPAQDRPTPIFEAQKQNNPNVFNIDNNLNNPIKNETYDTHEARLLKIIQIFLQRAAKADEIRTVLNQNIDTKNLLKNLNIPQTRGNSFNNRKFIRCTRDDSFRDMNQQTTSAKDSSETLVASTTDLRRLRSKGRQSQEIQYNVSEISCP